MFTFYLQHEWWFAAVQLGLAMFGMGATLRIAEFVAVFRAPRPFIVGLLFQVVAAPLLALAVEAALGVAPGIAFGLLLVSAMPGGAMSNVATYFAKGNVPLSIALTAVATLGCMVTTPIVLRSLAGELVRDDFTMPVGTIALDIAVCLLVPLAAGMAVGAALPSARGVLARFGIRSSLAVVICIAIGSAGAGRLDTGAHGWSALVAVLVFALAVQLAGTLPGWLLCLRRADLAATAIETTIRNTNLALLLKASLFPVAPGAPDPLADAVLFVALLYAGLAAPAVAPLVLVHRWLAQRRHDTSP